jgi:peptidoglycan/xylan/chitin deacetylase (PgdA/CDA1 family)
MKQRTEIVRELRNAVTMGVLSAGVFLIGVMAITQRAVPPVDDVGSGYSMVRPHTATARFSTGIESSTGVPVLCYHYLREKTTPLQFFKILGALFLNLPLLDNMDLWTQTAPAFEKQMAYLKNEGYESVDLGDLARWRRGQAVLPRKPIVITFDDGDRSVLDIAYPILKRYGFKATLFVVTSKVGEKWERVDCLGWDDLKTLEMSGVFSIQSHSHDLHRKVATEEAELPLFVAAGDSQHRRSGNHPGLPMVLEDLRRSKQMIEDHLGSEAKYLAWPYGFADGGLDSVAVEAGFDAFCTLEAGTNGPSVGGHRSGGTGVWLTGVGSLAPQLCVAFNWTQTGWPRTESFTGLDALRAPVNSAGGWGSLEIKRYTITSRTSIRTFREILADQ